MPPPTIVKGLTAALRRARRPHGRAGRMACRSGRFDGCEHREGFLSGASPASIAVASLYCTCNCGLAAAKRVSLSIYALPNRACTSSSASAAWSSASPALKRLLRRGQKRAHALPPPRTA